MRFHCGSRPQRSNPAAIAGYVTDARTLNQAGTSNLHRKSLTDIICYPWHIDLHISDSGMSDAYRPYLKCVQSTLAAALCLQNFPCQQVERQNKPEVEFKNNPELLLKPILICRSEHERCYIEVSVNSVRVSFKIKQTDQLDALLVKKYMAFLMQRAEAIGVLRRVPLEGYDISFLITDFHCQEYNMQKLIDFIGRFMEDINAEIHELKLLVNTRGRAVAADYMKMLSA